MTPFAVAFDIQRDLLETGRQTVETGVDFQQELTESLVDGIESQREAQRRILGLQYVTLRRTLRRTDEETPGPAAAEEVLRDIDHQIADLQADQEEAFDTLIDTLEETGDALEEATMDSLDTVEEQLSALSVALEQLEQLESDVLDTAADPDE